MTHPSFPFGRAVLGSSIVATLAAFGSLAAPRLQAQPPQDQTVTLDPFQVVTDRTDTYQADNFTSLSGINQSLSRLPVAAEIFNSTRLSDLAETDVVDLLNNYATGVGQSFASSAATGMQGGDRYGMSSFNIRGLPAGAIRRNGFLTANNLSEMFESDRVEIIDGPQSLLFGTNPAGGVINEVTKQPVFGQNWMKPMVRLDSHGTVREQLDGNAATNFAGHDVAIRISALESRNHFYRDVLEQDYKGIYADLGVVLVHRTNTVLRFLAEEINGHMYESASQLKVSGIPTVVPNNSVLSVLLATNPQAIAQIDNGYIDKQNVDSLLGYAETSIRRHQYYEATLSSDITPWLKGEFMASQQPVLTLRDTPNGVTAASAPLTNGNPLNSWAIGFRPAGIEQKQINEGLRALLTANFALGRVVTNTVVVGAALVDNPGWQISQNYYATNGSGQFVYNQTALNNADGGRTIIPIQWVPLGDLRGYTTSFQQTYSVNGVTYLRDFAKYPNPAYAAAGNPLGYNGGSSGVSLTNQISRSTFATLNSAWFGGVVDTMAGIRYDNLSIEQKATGAAVLGSGVTGNVGFVWHFSEPVGLFGAYSSNFSPGSFNFASNLSGGLLPNGRGTGSEAGFKITALQGRLSGSISAYDSKAVNNSAVLSSAVQTATDPNGINGRYYTTFANPSITYDSESKGVNVFLAGEINSHWRVQVGYSLAVGKLGNAVYVPFHYNDQFNVNSANQVTIGKNGPVGGVTRSPTTPVAATYGAGVATEPLTVAILKSGDASGNYKAQLDASNGQILNASALGLTLPGVATGTTGLPISQHQLGFTPPLGANYLAQAGGDTTQGYPRNMVTLGSTYEFSQRWLRGVSLGANVVFSDRMALYYYVVPSANNARTIKYAPDSALVNLVASYEHSLGRKTSFKTQLNVNNVFDDRAYTLYENVASGVYDNAGMRINPLTFVWTNSITF